jgi:hypothetical protein
MTSKPSSTGSNPLRLTILGKAALKAGRDNDEPQMIAAGERALRLARKAMREGKGGLVTDGEVSAIVEK